MANNNTYQWQSLCDDDDYIITASEDTPRGLDFDTNAPYVWDEALWNAAVMFEWNAITDNDGEPILINGEKQYDPIGVKKKYIKKVDKIFDMYDTMDEAGFPGNLPPGYSSGTGEMYRGGWFQKVRNFKCLNEFEKVKSLGYYCFNKADIIECGTQHIISLGTGAFRSSQLRRAVLPNLTSMQLGAFAYAKCLEHIEMPLITSLPFGALTETKITSGDLRNIRSMDECVLAMTRLNTCLDFRRLIYLQMPFGYTRLLPTASGKHYTSHQDTGWMENTGICLLPDLDTCVVEQECFNYSQKDVPGSEVWVWRKDWEQWKVFMPNPDLNWRFYDDGYSLLDAQHLYVWQGDTTADGHPIAGQGTWREVKELSLKDSDTASFRKMFDVTLHT